MERNKVQNVTVIGTGFMGSGIAQVCAMAGFDVHINDKSKDAMLKAIENIQWSLEKLRSKGELKEEPLSVIKRIHKIENLEEIKGSDLVIEAIYESIPEKRALFETIDKIVNENAIIATNTSSIPLHLLSEKVSVPERFIGMHFFGPVALMKLVELVMGPHTSEQTLETIKSFVKQIGKTAIVVRKPSPGFLVNRIFNAAMLEALRCYIEGIGSPQDIDTGMKLGYGWKAGPFEIIDNAGIDIMAGVFKVMGGEVPPKIKEMLEKGYLGRKTGRGFYRYGPDGKRIVDEAS